MSRKPDSKFYVQRSTLPELRRRGRELLARSEDDLACLLSDGSSEETLQAKWAEMSNLRRAVDYLGDPDPRLDLYRRFGLELPPEVPTPQAPPSADRNRLRDDLSEEERVRALRIGRIEFKSAGARRKD
jgi:hypothetical protein